MDYGLTPGQTGQSAEGGSLEIKPKAMLTRSVDELGKITYRINSSSLSVIQECLRKAELSLYKNLRSEDKKDALTYGTAIHRGLEYWYCLPRTQRDLPERYAAELKIMQTGKIPESPFDNGVLEAVRQFVLSGSSLSSLEPDDARSISSGVKLLKRYFDFYKDDPFVVYRDAQGPMIERDFEFVLYEDVKFKVIYFGTIDCVLQNEIHSNIVVFDHKTSSRMNELASRAATSHQITGYIMAAHRVYGLTDVDTFIINGIQVAKTVHNLQRFPTKRTSEHFLELEQAVRFAIMNYEHAIAQNFWPQTAPGPCANYGGCPHLDICSVPNFLKTTILENKYGRS